MSDTRGRILIVDDEPSLLKMMRVYLERRGFSVSTCSSTAQASALFDMDPEGFSAVVLDATLEGLSMEQLALKMLLANSRLRVLASSGYPVDMSALEAAAPARVAFLHKPFTPEALAEAVRRMLGPEEKEPV